MMPQKKNPDVAELVRGKAARLIGCGHEPCSRSKRACASATAAICKKTSGRSSTRSSARWSSLYALTGAIATATFRARTAARRARPRAPVRHGLADFLVQHGLPFREAHHVVGALVREAETRGVQLGELPAAVLRRRAPVAHGSGARAALDPEAAVERRSFVGGPAKARGARGDRRRALPLAHESVSRTARAAVRAGCAPPRPRHRLRSRRRARCQCSSPRRDCRPARRDRRAARSSRRRPGRSACDPNRRSARGSCTRRYHAHAVHDM